MNTPSYLYRRKFAVVTGASSGIGHELAKQFANNGFDLLIAAEDADLAQAATELRALGAAVEMVRTDLSESAGVEKLCGAISSSGRPIDAIAINAGVGVGGDFRETDLQAELRLINLNCGSTVRLAKFVVSQMSAAGEVASFSPPSVASIMPAPFEAVYGASKAFVLSFAQALRNELKDSGVTVTALMPGPTETNFFHRASMDDTKVGTAKKDDPSDVARQGFEALMAGRDHIVAGSFMTKAQAVVAGMLPDEASAEMHRGMAT